MAPSKVGRTPTVVYAGCAGAPGHVRAHSARATGAAAYTALCPIVGGRRVDSAGWRALRPGFCVMDAASPGSSRPRKMLIGLGFDPFGPSPRAIRCCASVALTGRQRSSVYAVLRQNQTWPHTAFLLLRWQLAAIRSHLQPFGRLFCMRGTGSRSPGADLLHAYCF